MTKTVIQHVLSRAARHWRQPRLWCGLETMHSRSTTRSATTPKLLISLKGQGLPELQ